MFCETPLPLRPWVRTVQFTSSRNFQDGPCHLAGFRRQGKGANKFMFYCCCGLKWSSLEMLQNRPILNRVRSRQEECVEFLACSTKAHTSPLLALAGDLHAEHQPRPDHITDHVPTETRPHTDHRFSHHKIAVTAGVAVITKCCWTLGTRRRLIILLLEFVLTHSLPGSLHCSGVVSLVPESRQELQQHSAKRSWWLRNLVWRDPGTLRGQQPFVASAPMCFILPFALHEG